MRSPLIESVVLPLVERTSRSKAWSACREIEARQRHDSAQRAELREKKLAALFASAAEVDFWRDRVLSPETPRVELLSQVGVVTKSDLEASFPDGVLNPSSCESDLRFAATRGTTQRMICVHDFAKRDAMRAANMVTLRAAGYRLGARMVEIPPDICDVVCGEQGERDEGVGRHLLEMLRRNRWRDASAYRDLRGLVERNWVYNRKTYPPFGVGGSHPGDERLDYYLARLQQDKPYLLKGLTTYLYQIAKRLLERDDLRVSIPVIKPLGSGATPHMRDTIERAFHGRFWDDYGSAELGSVAFSCGRSEGMHILEDLFVVETLNERGAPTAPGELGEIVVTDLVNHAMPMIRYRVGDLGRLVEGECVCGRTSRRVSIEGRLQDALRDSRGRWVSCQEIADHLYRLPWIDQFQIIERREDLLEVTVAPCKGRQPIAADLQEYLSERLARKVALRLRTARTIRPEPGGKFRWVKALSAKPSVVSVPAGVG